MLGVGVGVSVEGSSVGVCVGSGVGLSGTTTLGGDTDGTEIDGTGTEIDGTDTEIDGIVGSPERVGVGRVMPSPPQPVSRSRASPDAGTSHSLEGRVPEVVPLPITWTFRW